MPADMKSMKQPSSLLCKHRANEGRCYFHGAVEDRLLSLAQTAKVNRLSCCTVLRSDDHGVVPLRKWQKKKKKSCLVTRYALHPADYTVGDAKDYYFCSLMMGLAFRRAGRRDGGSTKCLPLPPVKWKQSVMGHWLCAREAWTITVCFWPVSRGVNNGWHRWHHSLPCL